MYRLERVRKWKIVFAVLAGIFFVLSVIGFGGGGQELIIDGYVNDHLAAIVMVVGLFAAIICLIASLSVNALEKDMAEWLEILDKSMRRE